MQTQRARGEESLSKVIGRQCGTNVEQSLFREGIRTIVGEQLEFPILEIQHNFVYILLQFKLLLCVSTVPLAMVISCSQVSKSRKSKLSSNTRSPEQRAVLGDWVP